MAHDRETLAAIFASRVSLAKKTEEEAVSEARRDWRNASVWVTKKSDAEGSFTWFCQEFDLDVGAVRKAIKERWK